MKLVSLIPYGDTMIKKKVCISSAKNDFKIKINLKKK